jgi:AraC family transcriptional regulator
MTTPRVSTIGVPATTLVGVSGEFTSDLQPGADAHVVIPKLWERLMTSVGPALQDSHWAVGVMSDVEGSSKMNYLAAIRLDDNDGRSDGLEVVDLAGGTFLACEHVGSLNALPRTTQWFYTEYLPSSGVQLRDGNHLEIYDERFDPESPDSVVLICAPVETSSSPAT